MKKNATVAIPLVLAMLLSACGGGGGGDGASGAPAPSPAPAAGPSLAPAPAPAPAPTNLIQAGAFAPFGPEIIASNIQHVDDKGLTSAARLAGGGSVVAWSTGSSVYVQRLDAAGNAMGAAQVVGTVLAGDRDVSTRLSAVATADGGWLIAWVSADRSLLFRRYDAAGAPVGDGTPVDAATFTQVLGIQARALADGGFVVAWVGAEGTDASRAYVRRFDAAGTAVTDRLGVGNNAGAQSSVQITPMPDGHFLAAWVQGNPDGTESLLSRRLDAGLNGTGTEQVLQPAGVVLDARIHRYSFLGAASLSQSAALFAWAFYDGPHLQVRWQLLDALGTPMIASGAVASVDMPLDRLFDSVQAIPAAMGFRIVAESNVANPRNTTAYTTLVEIGGAGELLGSTETSRDLRAVSETTGAACLAPTQPGVGAAGGEDGRYLLAYSTCAQGGPAPAPFPPANLEVLGR